MSAGAADQPASRRRRRLPLIIALIAALIATVVVVVATRGGDDTHDSARIPSRHGHVTIKAADGIGIDALVTEPAGSGRHPLVIMPASYTADYPEYTAVGRMLTAAGFVTVAYTQRGFHGSGGTVDLAGPKTRRDARSVLDWALRNTSADPARVGMLGVSYGAGISLLAAAADKRVRAVVALSGWTDLAEAFHPDDTVNVLGLDALLTVPRAAPELTTLAGQLRDDPVGNGARFDAFVRDRSPVTYLAALNRNKPAIMLGNGWQDSLFSPSMLVPFYDRLTTPKRLQLSTGEHTGPEQELLAGTQSRTGDDALAWLEHYVGGRANGIDRQRPVRLEDVTTGRVQAFPRWPAVSPTNVSLAAPSTTQVAITPQQPASWTASLAVGQESGAMIGASQFVATDKYVTPTAQVNTLPSDRAFVWAAGPLPQAVRVLGSVTMTVSVASNSADVSLFVYLYDVAPGGAGSLMAMTPDTVANANGGTPVPVSITLEPIDWTLAPGHQLSVVVDTVEPWWAQAAPAGSTLTVSSTATNPAGLTIPVG